MNNGRWLVRATSLVSAAAYAVTAMAYLTWDDGRVLQPVTIWWVTLWLIGASSVAAAGLGQERAAGGSRVFALSVLAFLLGVALAAEALGIAISSEQSVGDAEALVRMHWFGFFVSWPAFLLALAEDVFALGDGGAAKPAVGRRPQP